MSMRAGDNPPHPLEASGRTLQQDPIGSPAPSLDCGRTARGLEVERVAESQHDPLTTLFIESLSSKYGKRIAGTVRRELGLDDGAKAIHADTAEQAIRMAETQLDVFGGANFFLELHCSATARGAGFLAACERADVMPASLAAEDIDRRFRTALALTSQRNQLPLSPQDGEWLLEKMLRQDSGKGGGA